MFIQTERLTIRLIEESDWHRLKEIWEDFGQSPYARYDKPVPTDDDTVRSRVARWAAANHGTEHMFFAACLNDILIGFCAFNIRENGYEIGYCFHSDFHGKGYAGESLNALFAHLWKMGIRRFTAGTALANTPSVSLLNALGFRQIGTEKVSFYQDDEGNDIVFEGGIFELCVNRDGSD